MSEPTSPSIAEAHRLARAYIDAVRQGSLPDELLTDDMTGWITTGGTVSKAAYQGMVRQLEHMVAEPIELEIDSLTAEGDRVVIEAHSRAKLINGETYANTYIYVLRIRGGLIASVAEHYNALEARDKLVPLMKAMKP